MVRRGMAGFEPFRGERYAPEVPLDLVVAPPYDVISPAERADLASHHPDNAVAVELPADPDPELGIDRYADAARRLGEWRRRGVLRRDDRPALYPYRMTDPTGRRTTGVIGALACGPDSHGVLPHEQTTPKDMTDRLSLLRACRANLSPIWGLSLAPGLADLCRPSTAPAATATAEGVRHELWVLDDPDAVAAVCRRVGSADVVLADGHHRFQTARTFAAEATGASATGGAAAGGADWVMAFVVELSPQELAVGPIHRAVVAPGGAEALVAAARQRFELEEIGAGDGAGRNVTAGATGGAASEGDDRDLLLVTRSGRWRLHPTPATVSAAAAAGPPGGDDEVIDSALAAVLLADVPDATVRFDHDRDRVVAAVGSEEADAALLLRPVPVATIGRWAAAGLRMPPKSTYFWPKPRTGMVFRDLDG